MKIKYSLNHEKNSPKEQSSYKKLEKSLTNDTLRVNYSNLKLNTALADKGNKILADIIKSLEPHKITTASYCQLNEALENNNVEEFVNLLGTPQERSTKLNIVKKPNEFLKKWTKLFCLNKEVEEVYVNGSKNCAKEFRFYSFS